jgi:hypothetical protein
LQSKKPLPQGKDPRGCRRSAAVEEEDSPGGSSSEPNPTQVPLPNLSAAPASDGHPSTEPSWDVDDLSQPLRGLGWEGGLGEVVDIVTRDGDDGQRVWAWVQHVTRLRDRYTNPAGFLRTVLRGENWPEEEDGHDPERRQPVGSETIGDRLDVV